MDVFGQPGRCDAGKCRQSYRYPGCFYQHVPYPGWLAGIIPDLIKEETSVDLNVTHRNRQQSAGCYDWFRRTSAGSGISPMPNWIVCLIPNVCYSYTELESDYGASFAEARKTKRTSAKVFHQMVITTHY